MGRRRTTARVAGLLAVLACACAVPASAQEQQELSVLAGNSQSSASVDMLVIGPPFSKVDLYELVNGQRVLLQTVATPEGVPYADGVVRGAAAAPNVVRWRCDRRTRDFVGEITFGDGRKVEDWTNVRTPSCDKRFKLAHPSKTKAGRTISIRTVDSWRLGDQQPKLCVKPPQKRYKCRKLGFRKGRSRIVTKQRVGTEGTWRIQLRGPTGRITTPVAVGVPVKRLVTPNPKVLLFGDSLMSNLVTPITDRLGRRVDTLEDLRGGSGLLDASFNWFNHVKASIAKNRPKAVAMLIGAGDGFPIAGVNCCSDTWSDLYSAKVARMMRTVRTAKGKPKLVWVLVPGMRGEARQSLVNALVRAGRKAAEATAGVKIADLGSVLTPGGFYADSITVNGRRVRVRAVDGVHLTVAGADLAAREVVRVLKPLPR